MSFPNEKPKTKEITRIVAIYGNIYIDGICTYQCEWWMINVAMWKNELFCFEGKQLKEKKGKKKEKISSKT